LLKDQPFVDATNLCYNLIKIRDRIFKDV